MSSYKPSSNRPTDPFGGPPNRRSTASIAITLVALVVFALVQFSKGGLGNLFNGAAGSDPTVATSQNTTEQANSDDSTPAAKITATARPTQTPKSSASAKATATPHPTQTPQPASATQPRPTKTPRPTASPSPTANAPPVAQASDLPTVALAGLPPEAQQTVSLIDQGGPFPYSRDGIVFENRERILPSKPNGYYHEYTVITPGSNDRGARRVIRGEEGEMYYTDDHYATFREIMR